MEYPLIVARSVYEILLLGDNVLAAVAGAE
jgi:hypothetical protein